MTASMPTHETPRGAAYALRHGEFVDYGDTVVLRAYDGNSWPLDWVQICQGAFSGDEEGVAKLPRPTKYDARGRIVVQGDMVAIFFEAGNPKRPVVFPGIRNIQSVDFLPWRHDADGAGNGSQQERANRWAMRVRPVDDDGNELGRVDIEFAADGTGSRIIYATDHLTQSVGGSNEVALSWVHQAELIEIFKSGTTSRLIKLSQYAPDEIAALTEISSILLAFGFPITQTTSFIQNLAASVASTTGAPYSTARLKSE